MAGKGWTTQVAAAAGVAAGTGAAQLGLGYGLGVVVWPIAPTRDDSVWLGSLGWATWIAASATVFGAVIAARLRGAQAPPPGGPWRLALAASAAVGALLTVVLVAVPARAPANATVRVDTFAPEVIAGGYALIGILLGLIIAYWAVVNRAVAANLIGTAGYLWALAAAGIVVELTLHRESATYLTSWQFAELGTQARYGTIFWPSALLTLLAALVIGLIAAWPSVRAGNLGVGTATSGAVGPLLVAASFLALAPQLTGALGQLQSAYLIAPYAVLSGLAGSALMVAAGRRSAQRRADRIARIHRPAPPAATGKAPVPAQPDGSQNDVAQMDTPPTGTPQVSATTPTQRSRRSADPAQSPAAAGKSEPTGATAASQADDEERTAAESEKPSRWGRLRRGGRTKPAPTAEPDPASTSTGSHAAPTQSGPATARSGASAATPSQARASIPSPAPTSSRTSQAGATAASTSSRTSQASATAASTPSRTSQAGATAPSTSSRATKSATPRTDSAPRPDTAPQPDTAPSRPSAPSGTPPKSRPAAGSGSAEPKDPPKPAGRSTVAAPPPAPPIAKINPPRDAAKEPGSDTGGEATKATPSRTKPAKPQPDRKPEESA